MLQNKYNISVWQGSTFGVTVSIQNANGTPKDISGHTARMQIRSDYESTTIVESLTTSNGEIVITNAANGTMQVELSAARTANIPVDLGTLTNVKLESGDTAKIPRQKYVYDLEIDSGTNVSKVLYGEVLVYGEVTR